MTLAEKIVDTILESGVTKHGLRLSHEPSIGQNDTGEGLARFLAPPSDPSLKGYCENERLVNQDGPMEFYAGDYNGWRILYRDNDRYIGVLQGVSRGRQHVASNIFVLPEFRGKGIAKRLMQTAQQWKRGLMVSGSFTGPGASFAGVQVDGHPRSGQ